MGENELPDNPDVAYNNGHLLFQATFFIGPVNFYYDLGEAGGCLLVRSFA